MPQVEFQLDGQTHTVPQGTKVHAAIYLAEGLAITRRSEISSQPRAAFCGIGCCHECLVTVNGIPKQRGCLIRVTEGMMIERNLS